MLNDGFYTAVGTPTDENGNLVVSSFVRQIEEQMEAGAAGLLVLGSMGIQPYIKDEACRPTAGAAAETVAGRCPVFVGTMDNSVGRVSARIQNLAGLKIDGIVVTTPYYFFTSEAELLNYFTQIANISPFPVYLYDLPTVTKNKIAFPIVQGLIGHKNILGIKSADLDLCKSILDSSPDFQVLYSGLDTIIEGHKCGLKKGLDGMFSLVPGVTSRLFQALAAEDYDQASVFLDEIVSLRNDLIKVGVLRGYSHAMNLIGYDGRWCPDYAPTLTDEEKEHVRLAMESRGLLP